MPIIIFMTDGYATDNWEQPIEEIRKNRWFRRGTKIGFALGEDPDVNMISSVVGNCEAVIKVTDLELFKRLMKFVSVTSSMLVSQSTTPDTKPTGETIVKEFEGLSDENGVHLDPNQYNPEPEPTPDPGDGGWGDDEEW